MEINVDKKTGKKILVTLLVFLALYLFLRETERVTYYLTFVFGLFSPFLLGAALAFILNVPMRFIERKLSFIKNEKILRVTSIVLTLLAVVAVIAVVVLILVPQISDTVYILSFQLPNFFERLEDNALAFLERYPQLKDILGITGDDGLIDWVTLADKLLGFFETGVSDLLGDAVALVGGVISAVYNAVFSFIFAFYCLARKETLARQARKMLYALAKEKWADEIVRILRMSNSVFSNFITGQCLDAVILGIMCAFVMLLLHLPYIPLICVIIVVTALIPVMGALIGCGIGAFLIFVNDPMQALIFIVMFIIVQQIDNNIIYPRVVGSSIGLPGMWVLLAVFIGEGTMGVAGMLLMVPFASVIYTLLREFAAARLNKRNVSSEKLVPQPPELQPHFVFKRKKEKQQQPENEQP